MSGFQEVFGGQTIYPSQTTYISIDISANITLQWPIEQQITGDIVADVVEVTTSTPGLIVSLSSATTVSQGTQSLFVNRGANTFTVADADGGTIISIQPGEAWLVYLTDNTTTAGTWAEFQLGATVSVAQASALAGAGLKAITSTLNQTMVPTSTASTPVTISDATRAQAIIYTGGVGVADLPAAATVGSDWFFFLRNSGTGALVITPPGGTIDGNATLSMQPGESAIILTDGTNYFTIGYASSTSNFDFIEVGLGGQSGTHVLTAGQQNRISYRFSGALAGNISVEVPATVQEYWVDNQTTGGTFQIGINGQTEPFVTIATGATTICSNDSNNLINASNTSSISLPLIVGQGGTGDDNAAGARTNLGVPTELLILTAGAGLSGGGDLTLDRSFSVGAGTGITVDATTVGLLIGDPRNIDHTAVILTAGNGLIGGGDIQFSRNFSVGAGTGITVNTDTIQLDLASSRNVDHAGVTLIAGNGLTGGGDITANRTFTVLAAPSGGLSVSGAGVAFDISSVTLANPNGNDELIFDVGGGVTRKATIKDVVERIIISKTSFVVPIWEGFSSNPSTSFLYTLFQDGASGNTNTLVTITWSGDSLLPVSGTSNANFMRWDANSLPVEIRPITDLTTFIVPVALLDNGSFRQGLAEFFPDGSVVFYNSDGSGGFSANGFTTSGDKGFADGGVLIYSFGGFT